MKPETELVIELQILDRRIEELKAEIAELPKRIARIEKTLDQHTRRLDADRAALAANQRDRKKLEGEIQVQQQKASKFKDQMLGAKTNDQYRAFQHEITFCEDHIRKFEDRILELMGESEPLDTAVKAAEVNLKEEKQNVEREKKETEARTAADRKQLAEANEQRAQLTPGISRPVLSIYDRIRKRLNGVAIAEVTDGCCAACRMALRPQFFQELKLAHEVKYCESCKRILYYHPPVAVIDDRSPGSVRGGTRVDMS